MNRKRTRMLKLWIVVGLALVLMPSLAVAHLCNDVFVQAKDNLAVKVDIRDGQLRIAEEASFNVYLLNTMDRDIVTIGLEVISDQFKATVTPGEGWGNYPRLKAVKKGGKKQSFHVTLHRKPGVKDGTYKIDLKLYNPKSPDMLFKTIDFAAAAGVHTVAKNDAIKIDGDATKDEWKAVASQQGLYEYVKSGRYHVNKPSQSQARFRVSHDKDNICMLLSIPKPKAGEKAVFYIAGGIKDTPQKITIDPNTGKTDAPQGVKVVACKQAGMFEIMIPKSVVGNATSVRLNLTRSGTGAVAFWRGNTFSIDDPMVYDQFVLN